ncbi:MAG: hypothetical protein EHM57_08105 [Actinobacteria bacterium]|nr:MAG: hypothetical protein EHM57_08105 [Actinomycetota bacterium]
MTQPSNTTYPEPSQATTAFVLGLLGLVFGILAPFAWYIGSKEVKAIDAGLRDPKDRGLAVAGRVLGMVITILMIAAVVFIILALVLVLVVSSESSSDAWAGHLSILG